MTVAEIVEELRDYAAPLTGDLLHAAADALERLERENTAARALIPTWREWEANIDARGTAGPSDYGECAAMLAAALGVTEAQR